MALGACQYHEALPYLWELAAKDFEATMVYVAIGDTIVRLGRSALNDVTPILAVMTTGNKMLIEGAFRATAMLRMVPDEQTIDYIINIVLPFAHTDDREIPPSMRIDLRFWVAAAAPGWRGEKVREFLETCLRVDSDQLRRAAQAALEGKYLKWSLL